MAVESGLPVHADPLGLTPDVFKMVEEAIRAHNSGTNVFIVFLYVTFNSSITDIARMKPIMEKLPEGAISYNILKVSHSKINRHRIPVLVRDFRMFPCLDYDIIMEGYISKGGLIRLNPILNVKLQHLNKDALRRFDILLLKEVWRTFEPYSRMHHVSQRRRRRKL